MSLSIFLAQFLGIVFIIGGALFLSHRKATGEVIKKLTKSPIKVYAISTFEFLVGLAILLGHNIWTLDWRIIITVIGLAMTVEGFLYLLLPSKYPRKVISLFEQKGWFYGSTIFFVLLGILLVGKGFGFW